MHLPKMDSNYIAKPKMNFHFFMECSIQQFINFVTNTLHNIFIRCQIFRIIIIANILVSLYCYIHFEMQYSKLWMIANEIEKQAIYKTNLDAINRIKSKPYIFMQTSKIKYPILSDSAFGVQTNAAAIKRSIKYCQWIEKGFDTMDGQTRTRRYFKTWLKHQINSSNFMDLRYHNPESHFTLSEATIYSNDILINNITLDKSLFIGNNDNFIHFHPNNDVQFILPSFDSRFQYVGNGNFYLPYNLKKLNNDINNCTPGDIMVSIDQYSPSTLSVIGHFDDSTNAISTEIIDGFEFGVAHSKQLSPRNLILQRYKDLWKYFNLSKIVMFFVSFVFLFSYAPTYRHRIMDFTLLAVLNLTIKSYIWKKQLLNPHFWTGSLISMCFVTAMFRNSLLAY